MVDRFMYIKCNQSSDALCLIVNFKIDLIDHLIM